MMSFLHKSKATILDLMKMLPDAHIAEVDDFEAWGWQFIDVVVSCMKLEHFLCDVLLAGMHGR
jgi:hypothetical protein